jgi:hypothetical protein
MNFIERSEKFITSPTHVLWPSDNNVNPHDAPELFINGKQCLRRVGLSRKRVNNTIIGINLHANRSKYERSNKANCRNRTGMTN